MATLPHVGEHALEARETERGEVVRLELGDEHATGRGRGDRRQPTDPTGRVDRVGRRLREERRHVRSLSHREVHAFLQLADERSQHGLGDGEQACVAGSRGECVDAPAEPVGEALFVSLDVPVLGEGLECPRELALVVTAELCKPYDPETRARRLVREELEHAEPACERCRSRVHRCIVSFACTKMQLGVNVGTEQHGLSADERRVCDAIVQGEDELVELVRALVALDTTTHTLGEPPRQERELQELLADRLRECSAETRVWEPEPGLVAGHPMVPDGFTFAGRPQLAGRFPGSGGGRTLLLNGHIDVVSIDPVERWSHPPRAAVVEDGRVHGRGACDMKGGVASMVFAAEMLARLGIRLAGDLIVNTVSEEESTGAGGLAMARTLRADAAIVPEPSGLDVWVTCRGSLLPTITVEGRAGHAGIPQRPWDEGGAVNAIEKLGLVLEAIGRLREHWAGLPAHPYLSPGDCVPTIVSGGEWIVSYPASCRLDCHIEYLPEQADEHGWGSRVEREFTDWIARETASDPWLAAHPPRVEWLVGGVPPSEVPVDHPIVTTALASTRAVGRASALGGLDNWHDGATLTVEAGIPAICLGPGDVRLAHTAAESVPIADLVACAQAIAVTAMRFCDGR